MKKPIATIFFASIVLVGFAMQNLAQAAQECNPDEPETTPASRFEINRTDATAFDTKTKLTWKICAEGQSFSEGHCTSVATSFTWDKAIQNFGGKEDGWRLPNVDELISIVEGRCQNPAINLTVFQDASSSYIWTVSSNASFSAEALYVYFGNGRYHSFDKTGSYYVRLVRGREWFDPLEEDERKQAKKAAKQASEQADKNSYVTCKNKASCDKTFSLTQIYINSMASQKIQVATDTIIETYNPTEDGNIGMSALKIPGKGSSAVIRLTVSCKAGDRYAKFCMEKMLDIYNGFRPFVSKMRSD